MKRSFSGSSLRAASSATLRHSQDGAVSSSTFLMRAGTPALRKYFCASTSEATCDHCSGTSTFAAWKTIEPSGLRISLVVRRKAISAYGDCPSLVKRRSIRIFCPFNSHFSLHRRLAGDPLNIRRPQLPREATETLCRLGLTPDLCSPPNSSGCARLSAKTGFVRRFYFRAV